MSIASTTIWEANASATASNVNGGGFNYSNANFLTDYTATDANTDSPVISSASYTFVAGDVGAWIYVQAGTNWTVGFYEIQSVAAGAATVDASVGAAVQIINSEWMPNTQAGCATVASPTGGTCGIDYSRGTAAIITNTDLACPDGDAAAPTVSSAGSPFGVNHVGNLINVTAGTGYTVSRYEIVSVSGTDATLDRAVGTDGAKTGGTFYVGGALSLQGANDDTTLEMVVAGNILYFKSGTYTQTSNIALASNGTQTNQITYEGYSTIRGDRPTASTRPLLNLGAFYLVTGNHYIIRSLSMTGTVNPVLGTGSTNKIYNTKMVNTGGASRAALNAGGGNICIGCEFVSRGSYAVLTGGILLVNCYIHNSTWGIYQNNTGNLTMIGCVVSDCLTYGVWIDAGITNGALIMNSTFYGYGTPTAKAFYISTAATGMYFFNNIFYGWSTAIECLTANQKSVQGQYNLFYNNTTNGTNYNISSTAIEADPGISGTATLSGATATTSGSVLTQSGGDFSTVTDNQDYVYIVSGTGITPGMYLITGHTSDTITLDAAPGTNATADKVWRILTGRNFNPGSACRAVGMPVYTTNSTNYLDLGGIQGQASSAVASS